VTIAIMVIMEAVVADMVEIVTEENQEQVKQNKKIIIKNRTLESTTPLYTKSVSLFVIG
jgi:hypothetical protein